MHNYFVYILTNHTKTVLYTGITNNLVRRISEHKNGLNPSSFTSKYKCFYLLFWEIFQYVEHAIAYEKRIKGWSRKKKEDLITEFNSEWKFLNDEIN